jgi:hypothetical protein
MRIANVAALIFLLWARLFYYLWNCYQMLQVFKRRGDTLYTKLGYTLFTLFFIFNMVAVLEPYIRKTYKFLVMKPKKKKGKKGEKTGEKDDTKKLDKKDK